MKPTPDELLRAIEPLRIERRADFVIVADAASGVFASLGIWTHLERGLFDGRDALKATHAYLDQQDLVPRVWGQGERRLVLSRPAKGLLVALGFAHGPSDPLEFDDFATQVDAELMRTLWPLLSLPQTPNATQA